MYANAAPATQEDISEQPQMIPARIIFTWLNCVTDMGCISPPMKTNMKRDYSIITLLGSGHLCASH
eukprot:2631055-Amphidinium_carterae.1